MATDHRFATVARRVLLVEDDEEDYLVTRKMLSDADGSEFEIDWEASYDLALAAMCSNRHDVYLVDYRLGERDGLELLGQAIDGGCDSPIILLTGQGDREVDLQAMRAGAMDFLVKGGIDATLLGRSIRYAVQRRLVERQREKLIIELEIALAKIKTLSGLLPICSSCKSIRDDRGYWSQIETYIADHSDTEFSHGICPGCLIRLYPDRYHELAENVQSPLPLGEG